MAAVLLTTAFSDAFGPTLAFGVPSSPFLRRFTGSVTGGRHARAARGVNLSALRE